MPKDTVLPTYTNTIEQIVDALDLAVSEEAEKFRTIIKNIINQKETIEKLLEVVRSHDLSKYKSNLEICFNVFKEESYTQDIFQNKFAYSAVLTLLFSVDFVTRAEFIKSNTSSQTSISTASTLLFSTLMNVAILQTRQKTAQLGIARNLMMEYETLLIKTIEMNRSISSNTTNHDFKSIAKKIIARQIKQEIYKMEMSTEDAKELINEFKSCIMQTAPESYPAIFGKGITSIGLYIMSILKANDDSTWAQLTGAGAIAVFCIYTLHSEYQKFFDKSHKLHYTIVLKDIINNILNQTTITQSQEQIFIVAQEKSQSLLSKHTDNENNQVCIVSSESANVISGYDDIPKYLPQEMMSDPFTAGIQTAKAAAISYDFNR